MRTTDPEVYGESSPYDDLQDVFDEPVETPPPQEELDLPVEVPPEPTLYERLMAAHRPEPNLRSQLAPFIKSIVAFDKGGGQAVCASSNLDWVHIMTVGMAVCGYSDALYELIPEEWRDSSTRTASIIAEALRKEELEACAPTSPWNLIKPTAMLYAQRY